MPASKLEIIFYIMHQSVCLDLEGADAVLFMCFDFYDAAESACAMDSTVVRVGDVATGIDPMAHCCLTEGLGAVLTFSPRTCTPCSG